LGRESRLRIEKTVSIMISKRVALVVVTFVMQAMLSGRSAIKFE